MNAKLLLIYYPEKGYLYRFTDHLQKKVQLPLRIRSFSEPEEFLRQLELSSPELVLVPEDFRSVPELSGRDGVFYFTETNQSEDPAAVFRYRPVEKILRQLLRGLSDLTPASGGEAVRLWGVYSPVHGCGQTAFALLLGQLLAEEAPTLYLNLERFSGFRELIAREQEGSLSDLLYYARVQGNPALKLRDITEYVGSLSLIFPAEEKRDLREASEADWQQLLTGISGSGLYRHIVLDIGDGPQDELWLLRLCDRIYMPLKASLISGAKELEWRELITGEDEELLKRVRRIQLPPLEEAEDFIEYRRLRFTRWGQFVKQQLKDEVL